MIEEILKIVKKNLFLLFLLILVSLLSFQLGRVSKTASQPVKIERASIQEIFGEKNSNISAGVSESGGVERIDFRVVVSKKSTSMKYHFLWCTGAKQIKEENKVYFNSEKDAISAGYSLASNCSK